MFNIETNFDDFIKAIDDSILSLTKFEHLFNTAGFRNYINKLYNDVRVFLLDNIDEWRVGEIDVTSDHWKRTKAELTRKPLEDYEEVLLSRGYPTSMMWRETPFESEEVKHVSEPWMATGMMKDDLGKGVEGPARININPALVSMRFSSAFRDFVEDYPNKIDETIMGITNGRYSLLQLYPEQRKKLIYDFVEIMPKIIDDLIGGKKQ